MALDVDRVVVHPFSSRHPALAVSMVEHPVFSVSSFGAAHVLEARFFFCLTEEDRGPTRRLRTAATNTIVRNSPQGELTPKTALTLFRGFGAVLRHHL